MPFDVAQLADSPSLPGDVHAGATDVYVGNARIVIPQLLGQKDRVVAGAATRHKHAKSIAEILTPTETVMIQLAETILVRDHQSFGLVAGIPQGERKILVQGAHFGRVVGWCTVLFTHEEGVDTASRMAEFRIIGKLRQGH